MSIPKNCMHCKKQFQCNFAMYTQGCTYYPPKQEKEVHPLKKFFGKFFK